MIERDLGLTVVSVEVHEGVARVVVKDLGGQPEERIAAALLRIEGIGRVVVSRGRVGVRAAPPGSPAAPAPTAEPDGASEEETAAFQLLPRVELFDPLIADPRQPHFSASYNWYLHDPELGHVGSATFSEAFALLGGALWGGRWEFGFLGGVFSIFESRRAFVRSAQHRFLGRPDALGEQGPPIGDAAAMSRSCACGSWPPTTRAIRATASSSCSGSNRSGSACTSTSDERSPLDPADAQQLLAEVLA